MARAASSLPVPLSPVMSTLPSVARGGKGDDTLIGGPEDKLLGGPGDNTILPANPPGPITVQESKSQEIWNEEGQYQTYQIECKTGRLLVIWHDETGKMREARLEAGQGREVRGDRVTVVGDAAGESTGTFVRQ